jgi:acetyl-CoA/propionyl-CoA carboxylase biotin carboxyl carrier protein
MPWEGHRDGVRVTLDGVTRGYAVAVDKVDKSIWLGRGGDAWRLHHPRRDVRAAGSDNQDGGDLRTPMPGTVVVVAGSAGEPVHEGDVIAVIEAMKMEYAIAAPFDGVLSSVPVAVGVQVERDQIVAVITPGSTS